MPRGWSRCGARGRCWRPKYRRQAHTSARTKRSLNRNGTELGRKGDCVRTAAIIIVQDSNQSSVHDFTGAGSAPFGNRNLALLDVLGESVLNRTIARLQRYGVQPISVVSDIDFAHAPRLSWDGATADLEYTEAGELLASVERLLFEYSRQDFKALVLIQLTAYAELDYFDVLRYHRDHGRAVTTVQDAEGALPVSVFNLKQEEECAELLRSFWNGSLWHRNRPGASRYVFDGYLNRLESPYDFRRLVTDALTRRCELRPLGREVRPRVWLGDGARVDSGARILAPAYVGAYSKVRTAALVTRAASIERNCEVDCGTVIDDATVLPFSYLGPGLEVAHALVDGGRLLHLARNLELEIHDRRLLGRLRSPSPLLRLRDRVMAHVRSGASNDLFAATDSPEPASFHTAGQIAP